MVNGMVSINLDNNYLKYDDFEHFIDNYLCDLFEEWNEDNLTYGGCIGKIIMKDSSKAKCDWNMLSRNVDNSIP